MDDTENWGTEMMQKLRARLESYEGATAVEYGIMVALIAVVIIAAVYGIGQALNDDFTTVEECLTDVSNDACPGDGAADE